MKPASAPRSASPATVRQIIALRPLTFILIAIAALILLRTITFLLPSNLLPWQIRDIGTLAVSVFIEAFPFIVLGALVSVTVQFWLPQSLIFKFLPRSAPLRRATLSLLGVLLPVCECGNVPLARTLLRRGLAPAEAITFLLAAPLLNPVTIVTTYLAFGFEHGILVARIIGGFLIANLVGFVFAKQRAPQQILVDSFRYDTETAACCADSSCKGADHPPQPTPLRAARAFTLELTALLPALALGSVLAAIVQALTPAGVFNSVGTHPVLSVLALSGLAAIISICSTVDAFFMLGFADTFMPGGIVAFLIFGAMIDIKMLLLLRTTFRSGVLALITLISLLGAVTIGLAVNIIA